MSMSATLHGLFEVLAWIAAIGSGLWMRSRWLADERLPMPLRRYPAYAVLTWAGAVGGAYLLGSLNMRLSLTGTEAAMSGGRSILGAILGGIVAAELYKRWRGIRGSTGILFVIPLAVAIAVGRIGCFLGGLADFTYGTATDLRWGVDFGDGVRRHPVQLYESGVMLLFLGAFLWLLYRRTDLAVRRGFYLFALFYGVQRFLWEFLKPYASVVGPFNVFHLASAALVLYALAMLWMSSTFRSSPLPLG